jgi:hypothetical protein
MLEPDLQYLSLRGRRRNCFTSLLKAVLSAILSLALMACDQQKAESNKVSSSNSVGFPPPVSAVVAPGSVDYLDFKNGFRDVVFGSKPADYKNMVLVGQDQASGNTYAVFRRSSDALTLNGIPLNSIDYKFLNNALFCVSLGWDMQFTNTVVVDDFEGSSGIRLPTYGYALSLPSGLASYVETLYGKPNEEDLKETPSASGSSKRIGSRTVSRGWHGKKVSLKFFELQNDWANPTPKTMGAIDVFDAQVMKKVEVLQQTTESNNAAKITDSL